VVLLLPVAALLVTPVLLVLLVVLLLLLLVAALLVVPAAAPLVVLVLPAPVPAPLGFAGEVVEFGAQLFGGVAGVAGRVEGGVGVVQVIVAAGPDHDTGHDGGLNDVGVPGQQLRRAVGVVDRITHDPVVVVDPALPHHPLEAQGAKPLLLL